jgi:hypothetical protein
MKIRVGNPCVEDILTETVDIKNFSDLEGWDQDTAKALSHFMHGCIVNKAKHTSCVFLAWNELKSKEWELLLPLFSKQALGLVGLICSAFLPTLGINPEEILAGLKGAIKKAVEGGKIDQLIIKKSDDDDDDDDDDDEQEGDNK